MSTLVSFGFLGAIIGAGAWFVIGAGYYEHAVLLLLTVIACRTGGRS